MSDNQGIALVWILGSMVLVGSALARRRISGGRALPLALLWAGIILIAWGAAWFGQRFLTGAV